MLVRRARTYYRIPAREDLDRAQLPAWITRVEIEPMQLDGERLAEEGPAWMQYWDENIKGGGVAAEAGTRMKTGAGRKGRVLGWGGPDVSEDSSEDSWCRNLRHHWRHSRPDIEFIALTFTTR